MFNVKESRIFLTGLTDTEPPALLRLVTWLIENKALSENVFVGSRAETIQNEGDFIELQPKNGKFAGSTFLIDGQESVYNSTFSL